MPAPVIIVTGVSRGIGRAIAEDLQSRGAAVVGAARNVTAVRASRNGLPGPPARNARRPCGSATRVEASFS